MDCILELYLQVCVDRADADAVELFSASQWPGVQTVGAGKPFTDTAAKWIWIRSGAQDSASTAVRPTFYTIIPVQKLGTQLLLHIIPADATTAEIFLNGVYISKVSKGLLLADYLNRPVRLTLNSSTASTLSVRVFGMNAAGAGLLASVTSLDGKTVLTRTDSSWTYTYDVPYLYGKEVSCCCVRVCVSCGNTTRT
jgi:hypothetical protein